MIEYNDNKKDKLISLGISLGLHALLILLLIYLGFSYKAPEEESGVLLMVGEVELSSGNSHSASNAVVTSEPASVEEPAAQPESAEVPAETVPSVPQQPQPKEPLIAQNNDDAPNLAAEKEKKRKEEAAKKAEAGAKAKAKAEADAKKAEEARKKAEADAKAKAEAEAKRKAEEEAARRKAEEDAKRKAAQNLVTGAFGNNSGTGDKNNGIQGSVNGNSANGASRGEPGISVAGFGGRGIIGRLQQPKINKNANGKIVLSILINSEGQVVGEPTIGKGTTISDLSVREAVIAAAKQTRFEKAAGTTGNVSGTITYIIDSNN